jgi:hypothetical protein
MSEHKESERYQYLLRLMLGTTKHIENSRPSLHSLSTIKEPEHITLLRRERFSELFSGAFVDTPEPSQSREDEPSYSSI